MEGIPALIPYLNLRSQSRSSDQTLGEDVDRDTMKVEIIVIDTIQLTASPNSTLEVSASGKQWIEHQLSHSDADYLTVAGQSLPAHLVPGLEELLQNHKVPAYVSVHLHC